MCFDVQPYFSTSFQKKNDLYEKKKKENNTSSTFLPFISFFDIIRRANVSRTKKGGREFVARTHFVSILLRLITTTTTTLTYLEGGLYS